MTAESVHEQRLRTSAVEVISPPRLTSVSRGRAASPRTVAALCEEYRDVCASAVDPLEIASALEFGGLSDQAVKTRYGYPDVFALAQDMYFRVGRRPAEPPTAPDPWQVSRFRPALHGLLYGVPAVCFPAAAGLLAGPGALMALIVALLAAWSLSQALAYLGYIRLGRTGPGHGPARRVLRAGLAITMGLVLVVMAVTGLITHSATSVLMFGVGEGAYMLGACVLLVLGMERWLLISLIPGVIGSGIYLALGRPPGLEHFAWAALAGTPLVALVLAVVFTRKTGKPAGKLFVAEEVRGAVPAAAFGLVAAGLLSFPVAAGVYGHGGVNTGALLATLPLSLSMGAAEWSLLWYRRKTQWLLGSTNELRHFARRARLTLLAAVAQYAAGAVALTALAVLLAGLTGLVHPHWSDLPQLAAYLALGVAMFTSLTVQAFGLRAFTLAACSAALAFELAFRELGVLVQVVACTELLIVVGAYATVVLGKAVRHAY
jgi:hypothetical protein